MFCWNWKSYGRGVGVMLSSIMWRFCLLLFLKGPSSFWAKKIFSFFWYCSVAIRRAFNEFLGFLKEGCQNRAYDVIKTRKLKGLPHTTYLGTATDSWEVFFKSVSWVIRRNEIFRPEIGLLMTSWWSHDHQSFTEYGENFWVKSGKAWGIEIVGVIFLVLELLQDIHQILLLLLQLCYRKLEPWFIPWTLLLLKLWFLFLGFLLECII